MRNLARLTNAANRVENGPRRIDRRKLPQCATEGCRRRVDMLKDGSHTDRCDRHFTDEERERYYASWLGPQPEAEELLDLLSEGLDDEYLYRHG